MKTKMLGINIFLLWLVSSQVYGQSIYGNSISAGSAGIGGASVSAPVQPLDIMVSNPAGLATVDSEVLQFGFLSAFAQGRFSNAANANAPIGAFAAATPYGAFVTPLGHSRFKLGISSAPESSMTAHWRYVDAPGGAGNVSYGLQDDKSAILALRSAVGLGFALTPRLSVGATLGWDFNSNTLQTPYVFQSQPVLKGLKTLVDLRTQGVGVNGSFGVSFRQSSRFQFGLSYKTRTDIHSHGEIDGNVGQQLAALGLSLRPDFHYNAQVDSVLPQMASIGVQARLRPRLRFALQADWINWNKAFVNLPLTLTNGNNSDLNTLLGGNSLKDFVPLLWHNQGVVHAGVEMSATERTVVRGGYSFASNPVPATTLTPMTAAIMRNTLSTGAGYLVGRYRLDASYQYELPTSARVSQSLLRAGEYSNSRITIGVQTVFVTTSIRF